MHLPGTDVPAPALSGGGALFFRNRPAKLRRRAKALPDGQRAIIEGMIRRNMTGLEQYTEEDWDELRAVYLGMCMKVDAQFGRILDALKKIRPV